MNCPKAVLWPVCLHIHTYAPYMHKVFDIKPLCICVCIIAAQYTWFLTNYGLKIQYLMDHNSKELRVRIKVISLTNS